FGLQRIAKNYYLPGFHEPGSVLSLGINRRIWDGFSETDQRIFAACAGAENAYSLAEFNTRNMTSLETLVKEHEVTVREFSDALFRGMFAAARDVVAAAGNRDPLSRKVYESYMTFRKAMLGWTTVGDQAYFNKRALVDFAAALPDGARET